MNKVGLQYFVAVFILLSSGWLGWQEVKAQGADWLPIKYIRIEGAFQYIVKDKIKQVLKTQVVNGLYNADIQNIQHSVEQLPWIENVRVKRVWPDTIDIKIHEQTPIVRWGKMGLLNEKGVIFRPENIEDFSYLPLLTGPKGNEKKLLEIMKGLSVALDDQKMKLAEFHVNKRRAWRIKLQSGLGIKLGRNAPLNKFQRFLETIPLIGEDQIVKVALVDLRYPNGYALRWKQGKEKIDWKEIARERFINKLRKT